MVTVIAAPISPWTTASPVACTYTKQRSLNNYYSSRQKSQKKFTKKCHNNLFSSVSDVNYVLYAIIKKGPRFLKVRRWILHHHQLCGVIDARQRCTPRVPVHLKQQRQAHEQSIPVCDAYIHLCCIFHIESKAILVHFRSQFY